MPTMTTLVREDERVVCGWTWWHLNKLFDWMEEENSVPEYISTEYFPFDYVFLKDHVVEVSEAKIYSDGDPDKIEKFEVKSGDKYQCWRQFGK
jgi:hypothetical protein